MDNSSSPSGSSAYFESLMKAGQQSMKQFDDALAAAMGVHGKAATSQETSPFAMVPDYVTQAWRFWNVAVINTLSAGMQSSVQPSRGDRRFKDDASPAENMSSRP
jgi:polyhydroxyalkanoate synthase